MDIDLDLPITETGHLWSVGGGASPVV